MLPRRDRDALVGGLCRCLGAAFRSSESADSPPHLRAILVLLPCCVGDVLMATPMVDALRAYYSHARIDFAVGPWSRPILEGNPHIDELVDTGGAGEGGAFDVGAYLSLIGKIRRRRYDACFVLNRSPSMTALPFLARIPSRVGLDSEGRGFSLTVRVPVEGVRHEAERYLDTLRALGIQPAGQGMVFHPTEEDKKRVDELLPSVEGERRIIAIHPGGGSNPGMQLVAKRWPSERFAAAADAIMERSGRQIALVGGPSDSALSREIRAIMKGRPVDLTGDMSWGELGAFLQGCELFIGNDTGAMHMATAIGTPVVALFGPSDPRCYGPYKGKGTTIWHDVGCNPCFSRGRFNSECTEARCILSITVEEVVESAMPYLEGEPEEGRSGTTM
jgi:lipopolysaccharide heptosyltransferase II